MCGKFAPSGGRAPVEPQNPPGERHATPASLVLGSGLSQSGSERDHVQAAVVLTREQAPIGDSERSTAQTVARMAELIRASLNDPLVILTAGHIARMSGTSNKMRARGVFYWLKSHVTFENDDRHLRRLFGERERDQLELLIEPRVLLRTPGATGDCDDFTMLACALLLQLGIPAKIVTAKADRPEPWRWSHVYALAELPGDPIVLDCSHGIRPGQQIPYYYQLRYWDARTGRAVRDIPGNVARNGPGRVA